MEKTRLILMDGVDPALNMAYDEAVVLLKDKLKLPTTLRFYRWKPSAITIGYFQSLFEEVDVKACDARSIKYIRRLTGGGAVYHDYNGEVTYSLIIDKNHELISQDVLESYDRICNSLIFGLKKFGLDASYRPVNDIIVGNRKISGNAQTRKGSQILQHGTILCDVDPKLMFTLLKVPNEKLKDKIIKRVEDSVTSIKKETGELPDHKKIIEALAEGFARNFSLELTPGSFTEEEESLAKQLAEKRYGNPDWNERR
ncbi:MAG: lipoate--protein ligase family protein [Pseudomonadota bacterium]